MRIRFDGKTAVVSGAGHGFGRCIGETFAQLGACAFGCELSAAELAETATGVKTEVLDLTDRTAAAAWIAQIEQTTGGAVDVSVNNAGAVAEQEMHPIEEVPDADWDGVFADQLARELGPFGITVNSVAPGFVRSNAASERQWAGYGEEEQKAVFERIAMKRLGTPQDMTNSVVLFVSELASFVNGQVFAVDGGK